jgi:hypothetical protein
MKKRLLLAMLVCAVAGLAAAGAVSSAPPVGPVPPGPVQALQRAVGETFAVTLPKPECQGACGEWRARMTPRSSAS